MVVNILFSIVAAISVRYSVGGALKINAFNPFIGVSLIMCNIILAIIILHR